MALSSIGGSLLTKTCFFSKLQLSLSIIHSSPQTPIASHTHPSSSCGTNFHPVRTWFSMKNAPLKLKRSKTPSQLIFDQKPESIEKHLIENIPVSLREEDDELEVNELIEVGRHVKITASGRLFSFSALVLGGDGHGMAGIGFGKGASGAVALDNAKKDLTKNMVSIYRYRGNSIAFPIRVKYRTVRVTMIPTGPEGGLSGNDLGMTVCQAFGLTDLKIAVRTARRTNKHNTLLALFKAVTQHIISPEEHAKARGKRLVTTNQLFPKEDDVALDYNRR